MEQAFMEDGTTVDKGENARLASFVGAIAIADLVKTTLGPKGMDKILQRVSESDQSVSVTNDGATILRSINIDNAAAKVLVDIARVQDDEVGDGTTTVAVLCGELLREAEKLVAQRIHPQTIAAGWRLARRCARDALESSAVDNSGNEEAFRSDLLKIARTTLSSKLLTHQKEYFAKLAVDADTRLRGSPNLDHIQILKKAGGQLGDSYLEDGFLLDKSVGVGQPRRVEHAKILIANTSMDTDKIKIYGSRVRVDSMQKVAEIEEAEKAKMRTKVDKILAHGCNVFINRQLIYNFPETIFAERGVMAIEHADFDGVERLAAVTGGEVVSTFDRPDLVALGECDVVEEVMIGEDKALRLGGCKSGEACTIVLRGSSSHILDEAERSLHDALCILQATVKEPRSVYGGGCTEIAMAAAVDKVAAETPGKKALAMSAFARALRELPAIVADNGGYDSAELVTRMRAAHAGGDDAVGLDMYRGAVGNMRELGVMESYKSKLAALLSASEAAEMILRCDDIIKAAPRQREGGY
uniref:CCT-beta n=1 Tax=Pseudictyota dubia TaxID=2749911 RepID=A0A7R9WB64_9STRA|mmetsp:Transcript_40439/g.74870  ORF Transcript_40439/g.74870 Transcript_40439/m.74870 type:complete len:528 (+) Transcript_40439:63-1646(+)